MTILTKTQIKINKYKSELAKHIKKMAYFNLLEQANESEVYVLQERIKYLKKQILEHSV